MTNQSGPLTGQRQNAVRVHRLLAWFFVLCALTAFATRIADFATADFKAVLCLALAIGNHVVATGARREDPWMQQASLCLAGLMLVTGGVFFFTPPDIGALATSGNAAAAFAGSFAVVLAIIQIIAAVYLFLNSNWQRQIPPQEGPGAGRWP